MVWLGPESDDTADAIEAIEISVHSWPDRPERLQRFFIAPEDQAEYKLYAQNHLEHDVALEIIRVIARLLDRLWFRRVWTVQEVVLSPNIVLL